MAKIILTIDEQRSLQNFFVSLRNFAGLNTTAYPDNLGLVLAQIMNGEITAADYISSSRPTNAQPGDIIFNSTTSVLEYWNGFSWIDLIASGGGSGGLSVPSISSLRSLSSLIDGTQLSLQGYYSPGDGATGDFYYNAASMDAEDGGLTIKPDSILISSPGRWKRLHTLNKIDVRWFGAVGDSYSHPISNYYSTLAAAQAIYPHVTSLTQEIDWAASQAAVNSIKGVAAQPVVRGGEVYFSGGMYVYDTQLNCDATFGLTLRGSSSGSSSGIVQFGGSGIIWTSTAQYFNPCNSNACISAKSSFHFTMDSINLQFNSPSFSGFMVDLGHFGGGTQGLTTPLPPIVFSGHTITRPSGSFINDGWQIGHNVHVFGSTLNDGNSGIITAISALVITTSASTWATETISFQGSNGLYVPASDTQFGTIKNCSFTEGNPGADAGFGPKAILGMNGAIICSVENCVFGTAQRGIIFKDYGFGIGGYSNAHVIRNCLFEYETYGLSNAGQDVLIDGCTFEGLGGKLVAYYDDCARTVAQIDCRFTFTPAVGMVKGYVTRSGGDFVADGWQTGFTAIAATRAGDYYSLGNVTAVTSTVLTVDGSVPNLNSVVDFYIYDDEANSNAGVESTSQVGNSLVMNNHTATRTDGLSFITDGWIISASVQNQTGGGYGSVVSVTDSVLTIDGTFGNVTYNSDFYIKQGGTGGGPLTMTANWLGDQFRNDSWLKTQGTYINLYGNFFNGNSRVLECQDNGLSGAIIGNVLSGGRYQEAILVVGTNGLAGLVYQGNDGGGIRDKSLFGSKNFSMIANVPNGDNFPPIQIGDDSFVKRVERYQSGLRITGSLSADRTGVTSLLEVDGAIATSYIAVTANTALDKNYSFIDINAATNNLTVTLPDATICSGREYTVKRFDNSGHTCTIATVNTQTIDGSSNYSLNTQNSTIVLISSGSNWRIKAKI